MSSRDARGELTGAVVVFRGVTARIEAMQDVKQSQERLTRAMRAGKISVCEWEPDSEEFSVSIGLGELIGFQPGEYQASPEDFKARLHFENCDLV